MHWIHLAAGLLVGFTAGLTGMGGGSLMTPILVRAFGFESADDAVELPARRTARLRA